MEWQLRPEERLEMETTLTNAGLLSPEGIEMFFNIHEQYLNLDAKYCIFRSCFFTKNGEWTNNCVMMQIGDSWPNAEPFQKNLGINLHFSSYARDAMIKDMTTSTISLTIGRGHNECSVFKFGVNDANFVDDDCKNKIRLACGISNEDTMRQKMVKAHLDNIIVGFSILKEYRDQRAAHHDLDYEEKQIILGSVRECIQWVRQVIEIIYPDLPVYAHVPSVEGEMKIIQNLKELAIRRLLDPDEESEETRLKREQCADEIEQIKNW